MDGGRGQLQINPGPSTGDESLAFEMPNGLKSLATAAQRLQSMSPVGSFTGTLLVSVGVLRSRRVRIDGQAGNAVQSC